MKKSLIFLCVSLFLLGAACSTGMKGDAQKSFPALTRQSFLLGPEAFDFCGGWVEFWVQVEDQGEKARLFLKATPGAGKQWAFWNDHIRLEHPHWPNKSLVLKDIQALEVGQGSEKLTQNTLSWVVDFKGLNPEAGLTIDLKPLEGCDASEALRGVVLSPSF